MTRPSVKIMGARPSIPKEVPKAAASGILKLMERKGMPTTQLTLNAMAQMMTKRAGEVERQVQEINDNNEGWRKWFHSMNRQDDFSYKQYLGKQAAFVPKHPLVAAFGRENFIMGKAQDLFIRKGQKMSKLLTPANTTQMAKNKLYNLGKYKTASVLELSINQRAIEDEIHEGEYPYDNRAIAAHKMKVDKKLTKKSFVLPGGLAEKHHKKPSDFCPDSLRQGMKVEKEHTSNKKIQKEIAMDHLTEDPNYYVKLKKMEKEGSWKTKAQGVIAGLSLAATPLKAGGLEALHEAPSLVSEGVSKVWHHAPGSAEATKMIQSAGLKGSYHVTADTVKSPTLDSTGVRMRINQLYFPQEGQSSKVTRIYKNEAVNKSRPRLVDSEQYTHEVSDSEARNYIKSKNNNVAIR